MAPRGGARGIARFTPQDALDLEALGAERALSATGAPPSVSDAVVDAMSDDAAAMLAQARQVEEDARFDVYTRGALHPDDPGDVLDARGGEVARLVEERARFLLQGGTIVVERSA